MGMPFSPVKTGPESRPNEGLGVGLTVDMQSHRPPTRGHGEIKAENGQQSRSSASNSPSRPSREDRVEPGSGIPFPSPAAPPGRPGVRSGAFAPGRAPRAKARRGHRRRVGVGAASRRLRRVYREGAHEIAEGASSSNRHNGVPRLGEGPSGPGVSSLEAGAPRWPPPVARRSCGRAGIERRRHYGRRRRRRVWRTRRTAAWPRH